MDCGEGNMRLYAPYRQEAIRYFRRGGETKNRLKNKLAEPGRQQFNSEAAWDFKEGENR
jgi:hypothetical protein